MEGNFWGNIYPFWKDLGTFLCSIFKNQMLKNGSKKVPQEFRCEKCNYYGVRESQWKRHLETKKHNATKCYMNATKSVPHYECDCGKIYKHHSSFSRHKKVCKFEKSSEESKMDTYKNGVDENQKQKLDTLDILKTLMYDNKLLHEKIALLESKTPTMTNNTINSNNNNKIINVQMFLSEKCADAMSIQHFAKQLEVTLDDVCKSKKDCITNVVLKNLQPLSLTQRPFHCTNPKSKEWYIKDEKQGWEEDSGEKLLQNAEESIRKKWVCEFESRYPEWMENDQLREKYVEIAGSTTAQLPEKTKLKLLRELAGEVHLTKEDMV